MAEPQQPLLTARQAAWLVLRREEPRAEDKAPLLAQLRAQHADVAEAIPDQSNVIDLCLRREVFDCCAEKSPSVPLHIQLVPGNARA